MRYPRELRDTFPRIAMYLRRSNYDSVVAFIIGFDVATQESATLGFYEWLVPQLKRDHSSLHWSQLFLWYAFPDEPDKEGLLASPEKNKVACDLLCGTLEKFWDLREEPEGMRRIYHRYENWLRKQRWYKPDCPIWIDDK